MQDFIGGTKMKQIFVIVISTIAIIFILLALIAFLRVPISKGKILKPARLWVQLFWPPKDLFDSVVNKEINITNTAEPQSFKFTVKYVGPYTVGVLLNNFSDDLYRKKYDLKLRVRLDFYKNDALLISKETSSDYTPFYGKRGNGLMLTEFESTEDVPIDTEITGKLIVLSPDESLSNQYGPLRLYIQKRSEE